MPQLRTGWCTAARQHASTIDAARAADLALIRQHRDAGLDPAAFYRAAFVAAGDWR
jgi:hypothetical protein